MKTHYLPLVWAFVCPMLADNSQQPEATADVSEIVQQVTAALRSAEQPNLALTLKDSTYGKRIVITGGSVTGLDETNAYPLEKARSFAGLYVLKGVNHPEPSSLGAERIAEALSRLMAHANWRADADGVRCSGAGIVVVNQRKNGWSFTYSLLASSFDLRTLRLGQLVSLEATISGLSVEQGHLQVFGVLKRVQTR